MSRHPEIRYFSLFVTYTCNYNCSYCSEKISTDNKRLLPKAPSLSAAEFLRINSLRDVLPDRELVIHGGEPLLYPDLRPLLEQLQWPHKIIVVSNLSLDLDSLFDFSRLPRNVVFVGSYHPESASRDVFLRNVKRLAALRHLMHICAVEGHISDSDIHFFRQEGFDVVINPFVGVLEGQVFPESMRDCSRGLATGEAARCVRCTSYMLMIDPYGYIWNCHTHMYTNRRERALGNILTHFHIPSSGFFCSDYHYCDPCHTNLVEFSDLGFSGQVWRLLCSRTKRGGRSQ